MSSLLFKDFLRSTRFSTRIRAFAHLGADPRPLRVHGIAVALALLAAVGCGDDDAGSGPANDGGGMHDAGSEPEPEPERDAGLEDAAVDAGSDDSDDAGVEPDGGDPDGGDTDAGIGYGGLVPTTTPDAHELDLFGTPGHRFWVEVSATQLERMNQSAGPGGPFIDEGADGPVLFNHFGDDIYVPGNPATFADHVVVQDAASGSVADYGQLEVKLVGESTARQWDFGHIPNVRIDSDEFQEGLRIGGFEHIRLNNGLVGSIFREAIAHRVFRALDYPALRATWAFLGSNVWGPDVWVPMTLIEVYKRRFCDDNAELLGGTCENMWEFAGDIGGEFGGGLPNDACQVSDCDNTRMDDLTDAIASTPAGAGFKQALSPLIEWSRFHELQCISWMLWTGDDAFHNGNNNLIIERDDGKLIWAPYSVDISAGQEWYMNVPLPGSSTLARRCQSDPQCWADTIATCEELIVKFDAIDPELFVDDAVTTLTDLGMMRDGDEQRAEDLREWYVQRQLELGDELERYRYLPDELGNCPAGYERCSSDGSGAEQCGDFGLVCLCVPEGECASAPDGGVIDPDPIPL